MEPHFAHESEVVAGIGERRERYGVIFGEPDPGGPPLPPEYQQLPGAGQLAWQTHRWETWLDTFDHPEVWPAWALAKPHHLHTHSDGRIFLIVQTGWVWVGTQPEVAASAA